MKLLLKIPFFLLSICIFSQTIEVTKHEINYREGGDPFFFQKNNTHFFFSADDDEFGRELWKSDGTIDGTEMVKDINNNSNIYGGNSHPSNFIVLNNTLYFTAFDAQNGFELWRSNGTEQGTFMIKDINESTNTNFSTAPRNLYIFKNNIYFTAYNEEYGWELWKTDGTEQGTTLVKDINEFGDGNPLHFIEFKNELYFVANDGTHGSELWKTDGTNQGTIMIKDINNGTNDGVRSGLYVSGDYLFFGANKDDFSSSLEYFGTELWKSDGTTNGTVLVKDIYRGFGNGVNNLRAIDLNGILIFEAYTTEFGNELWRSDGTESGTFIIKDIDNSVLSSLIHNIGYFKFKNEIYFIADDDTNGVEIWKTDGTDSGTKMLIDINTEGESGNVLVKNFFVDEKNEKLIFYASDGKHNNLNLWVSDGTESGTSVIYSIVQPDTYNVFDLFIEFDNKIFVSGRNAKHRNELFILNPNDLKIQLFKDLNFKADSSPDLFMDLNGDVVFRAKDGQSYNYQLYKVKSSTSEIELIKRNVNIDNRSERVFIANKVVFSAHNGSDGYEPWVSDGTEDGTFMLKNIRESGSSLINTNNIQKFYYSNNLIFFSANNGSQGFEPWRTDGTSEGTFLLKDIMTDNNGTGHNQEGGSSWAKDFTEFNGSTYFVAFDNTGSAIWKTDGTSDGTTEIFRHAKLRRIHKVGNKLIFSGNEEGLFWESDGTADGTSIINLPEYLSIGDNKITLNNDLYFVTRLENIINRSGLYKTDGTPGNTTLLFEGFNHPNIDYIIIKNLTKCGGFIYFEVDDYYGGGTQELWRTNGDVTEKIDSDKGIYSKFFTCYDQNLIYNTDVPNQIKIVEKNTNYIKILNLELPDNELFSEVSHSYGLKSIGNILYFQSRTDDSGSELFSFKVDNNVLSTNNQIDFSIVNENFTVYPNPTSKEINIESDFKFDKFSLYDINGKLILKKEIEPTRNYKLEVSKVSSGFYFFEIKNKNKKHIKKVIVSK